MANSLLSRQQPQNNGNIIGQLAGIRDLMSGNPQAVFDNLMRSNPRFAEFVRQNQGKTPEQIAAENNIDMDQIRSLLGSQR